MRREVDKAKREAWKRWLTRKRAELMMKSGQPVDIGGLALLLGEPRANVEYWLREGGIPDASGIMRIYNFFRDPTIFDVLEIQRPDPVASLVEAVVTPNALRELQRHHPERFDQLKEEVEAVNGAASRQRGAAAF